MFRSWIQLGGLLLIGVATSCGPGMERISCGSGPEDLSPVRVHGHDAILTATAHRRTAQLGVGDPQGALELHLPGRDTEFKVVFPTRDSDRFPFFPTGICTVNAKWGGRFTQLVYVANSSSNRSGTGGSVEVFALAGNTATHLGKLGPGDLPVNPNGIAVAPDGSVYVSSFGIFPRRTDAPHLDRMEKCNTGINSIHCFRPAPDSPTKGRWIRVAGGFNGANGLAIDASGTHLLACSYHSKTIWCSYRNPKSGELTGDWRKLGIHPDFHPDNLKHLGSNRFTVCGQKSLCRAMLNLTLNFPVSGGGAIGFTLKDGEAADLIDLTESMGADRNSPTTALPLGGNCYLGHVISRGVSRMRGVPALRGGRACPTVRDGP